MDRADGNPVVLIHGIDDTSVLFHRLISHLQGRGRQVHAFDLSPSNGEAGIECLAEQVVCQLERAGCVGRILDFVGFSMGGLIARYIVQRCAERVRVQRLITVSAPHRGTWTAWLRSNIGAKQMRRGSAFLRGLDNERQALREVLFTSIWTPMDLMIIPAASSVIPDARSVPITVLAHPLMMGSKRVLRAIEAALDSEQ